MLISEVFQWQDQVCLLQEYWQDFGLCLLLYDVISEFIVCVKLNKDALEAMFIFVDYIIVYVYGAFIRKTR